MKSSKPLLKIRGFLYDLARSQRADLPQLKYVARALAEFGYNLMVVYLEHRFDYPSCPGLAPPGSLTPAMARELVEYGRDLGIEVAPMINLIGHCEGIAATERYAHLSCDPYQHAPWGGYEQLNLELHSTRKLVRAMIRDVTEAFPVAWLGIGGDEVRNMPCLFPNDPDRRLPKLIEHYRFVLKEARARDRQILVSGDMLLHHEALMKQMPRDLWILDWHYGAAGSRQSLEQFQREGFRVLATPAVSTCSRFAVATEGSAANLRHMLGDALDLGLDGVLVATWEFGQGSGVHLVWPWAAYAAALARGEKIKDADAYVAKFANRRYGVDGRSFVRLHHLLDEELLAALRQAGSGKPYLLSLLRKGLFRGVFPFLWLARSERFPENKHQMLSDPSPFWAWLHLRPALSPRFQSRLREIAVEATTLAGELARARGKHVRELVPIRCLAEAFAILVERVEILQAAAQHYHAAAESQPFDPREFISELAAAAAEIKRIRPGLHRLQRLVRRLDKAAAFSAEEHAWLGIQEHSLNEHLAALRFRRPEEDALLDFGEFLTRPAHVAPRLLWR